MPDHLSNTSAGQRRTNRRGLALMELIIALALTGVTLVLISTAIDLHLRTLTNRRAYAEEGQLARAVLHRIAGDLRNAVQYTTVDMSGALEGLDPSSLLDFAGDAAGGGGIPEDLLGGDISGSIDALLNGSSDSLSDATQNLSSTLEPPPIPGLYGNQYELQVDISRLPRVEEYHSLFYRDDPLSLVDIPSDVKTVTYFMRMANMQLVTRKASIFEDEDGESGLMRRRLDRAVTNYAASVGNIDGLINEAELMAPEIKAIEFRYFDGLQWLPEWDTDMMQGLPVAVEITVLLKSALPQQSSGIMTALSMADLGLDPDDLSSLVRYQMVVRLPIGIVPEVTEDNGMEAMGL